MRIKQFFTILALCLIVLNLQAQLNPKEPVVQITGVCLVSDSLFPAPYVSVIRSKDRRGTYSNRDGYFTIPAVVGDTLAFVCTGLETSFFIVPETNEHQLQVVQKMEIAPKELSPLYILPYPAPHELKQEVLALDLPGDGHQKFRRDEVSLAQFDGMVDFSDASYREAEKILQARYNNGFISGGNLLSTEAWQQFMTGFRKKK